MRGHAAAAGLDDAVIVNTCAVTAEAVRQAAQTIRKLGARARKRASSSRAARRRSSRSVLPACRRSTRSSAMPTRCGPIRSAVLRLDDSARVLVNDIMSVRETAHAMIDGFGSRARAYVQVQNGCDHRCTFCIIPLDAGRRARFPPARSSRRCAAWSKRGYREIVLTGVDITSYGRDLPGAMTLGMLVRHILRHVPELKRLRLSSIDQVEADAHLMDAIARGAASHAASASVAAVGRRHDPEAHEAPALRADAIKFCQEVRRLRPDMVFGADLIAGFPTETDAMFANSLRPCGRLRVNFSPCLPYSPRNGTPAARMPQVAGPRDQGPGSTVAQEGRARSERLSAIAGRPGCGVADGAQRDRTHAGVCRGKARSIGRRCGRSRVRPRHSVRRCPVAGELLAPTCAL